MFTCNVPSIHRQCNGYFTDINIRKFMCNCCKKLLSVLLVVLLLMQASLAETVVGDVNARLNAGQIEVNGEKYRLKKRLNSVLLIGTDQESVEMTVNDFRSGGQADFLVLLVADDNAETVTPIQINRDTMTQINTLNSFGRDAGLWTAQICLAHSFGDGKEQSCTFTVDAVSRYLNDAPVDKYISLNLDGITVFNDMLGGVEVTLEDDFSAYDESMTPGTTLVLHGKQAEYFVRMRYYVGDQSNASRLVRQKVYMESAKELLKEKVRSDGQFFEDLFDALDPYIITDMSKGRIINFADLLSRYEFLPMIEIKGESFVNAEGLMEFHPDMDSLQCAILAAFYEKIVA